MFPYKKGEFQIIKKEDLDKCKDRDGKHYFKCGIYRAQIKDSHILFHNNPLNYYTHIDLQNAYKLGLEIKLIDDDTPNFLYYHSSKCINSTTLFGNYVDYLYELKKSHPDIKYIKRILNILWGALSEIKYTNKYMLNDDSDVILEENEKILNYRKYSDNEYLVECREIGNLYQSGFARIAPFLTARGRNMISDLAIKHVKDLNNIYRIHTDSIITTEKLDIKLKEDCNLGDFGLEKKGKCNIINKRDVEWN